MILQNLRRKQFRSIPALLLSQFSQLDFEHLADDDPCDEVLRRGADSEKGIDSSPLEERLTVGRGRD